MIVGNSSDIAVPILTALGIDPSKVSDMTISLPAGQPPTIRLYLWVPDTVSGSMVQTMQEYRLARREDHEPVARMGKEWMQVP